MKVLLIQQKMIGDVLVSSLLCEQLKSHSPEITVHYLINENTTAVVEQNPFIDRLVIFRKEYRKNPWKFGAFLRSVSREKYDVVIDVYRKNESKLVTLFSGASMKIAYRRKFGALFYTHQIPIKSRETGNTDTTIDDRLGLLSPLLPKGPDPDKKPRIFLTAQEIEEGALFLKKTHIPSSGARIMMGILGSSPSKTYPLVYMARVIDIVAKNSNAVILLNYMPSQEGIAREVYGMCRHSTQKKIAPDTFVPDLRKFLGVLHHCDCYIGNEGGIVNMAKALEIPTFAIFAPWIHKKGWHTYGSDKHIAIHAEDYFPDRLGHMSVKDKKKQNSRLYSMLEPSLFEKDLLSFLRRVMESGKIPS